MLTFPARSAWTSKMRRKASPSIMIECGSYLTWKVMAPLPTHGKPDLDGDVKVELNPNLVEPDPPEVGEALSNVAP